MIAAGAFSFQQLQRALRFLRSPGDDFAEQFRRDAARAGTGDEEAAGREQADGAVVDLAVGAQRALEALLAFGESGRVEDDGVELAALAVERAQRLDRVAGPGF